jgi:hypothetical protein
MIPFNVELGGKRVGITLESLIWFFIATAAATIVGEIVYFYVQKYLPALPKTNNTVSTAAVQVTKVPA